MKWIFSGKNITNILLFTLTTMLTGCAQHSIIPATQQAMLINKGLMDNNPTVMEEANNSGIQQEESTRKMVLTFDKKVKDLSSYQQQIISLFFQTLRDKHHFEIIITAAPSSNTGFNATNDAWKRIKQLSHYLKKYSDQIQGHYLPNQTPDTVVIEVVGASHVQ